LPAFNISQMQNKLDCWFDGRVTGVVYGHTHQRFVGSCVKFSQTMVLVVKGSVRSCKTAVMWTSHICRITSRVTNPSSQSHLNFLSRVRVDSWLGRVELESSHKISRVILSH